jgi:hypothetical protein
MNQYLVETQGKAWPKKPTERQKSEISGWVEVIQSKLLADPGDVAAAALIRRWAPVWASIRQAYGF